MKIFENQSGQQ